MKRFATLISFILGLLAVIAVSSESKADSPYISVGLYNYGQTTYYIDGQGAYCQNYAYDNRWRQLTYEEADELNYMTYTGICGHP